MYDFFVGLAFTRVFEKKKRKDESTQVDFVSVTAPVLYPVHYLVSGEKILES
jgi:hypothetical protein